MKLEKIEGTEAYEVIKIVRPEEVEQATEAGWKLLGVLAEDPPPQPGPKTMAEAYMMPPWAFSRSREPMFVLGKTTDSVVAKALADVTKAKAEEEKTRVEKKSLDGTLHRIRESVGTRPTKRMDKEALVRIVDYVRTNLGISED